MARFGTQATLAVALWAAGADAQEHDAFAFRYDVLPHLQRLGCSAAECHGGAGGRGTFELSLFGSDPWADWQAIRRHRDARRVDLRHPEQSLLLRKPLRELRHGGGRRLSRDDPAYAALTAWLGRGAPFAEGPEKTLENLRLVRDGARLRALARFGVGTDLVERDVTSATTFSVTDERVARLSDDGVLETGEPGESWVLARFAHRSASCRVVVPFGEPLELPDAASSAIDAAWLSGLAELGLEPGPEAPPERLLRRLTLDLAGRLPTPAEVAEFAASPPATRVADLVERLLSSDDYVAVFEDHLAELWEVPPPHTVEERLRARDAALRARLRRAVVEDEPLDELARELAAPDGRCVQRFTDPRDRAEFYGRAVLGVRLGCARCHDHPLDRWRRSEHLGFAALFVDERPAPEGGMQPGVLFDEATGKAVVPRLLPLGADGGEGRAGLRRLLDGPAGQQRFARNVANRIVAALFGRGLVEPVDDHRDTNPPIHGRLLDVLAERLVANGFRLRPFVAEIARSRLYALDSTPDPGDALDRARARYLARREARPMSEALYRRAVARTLDVELPPLPRPSASPLAEQLERWNGASLRAAFASGTTSVDALVDFVPDEAQRLHELFVLLLARAPRPEESAALLPRLSAGDDAHRAFRELARAIVLGREFSSIR